MMCALGGDVALPVGRAAGCRDLSGFFDFVLDVGLRVWQRVGPLGVPWVATLCALALSWYLALWATGTAAQALVSKDAPVRVLAIRLVIWDRGGDFAIAACALLVAGWVTCPNSSMRLLLFIAVLIVLGLLHSWATQHGQDAVRVVTKEQRPSTEEIRRNCKRRTTIGAFLAAAASAFVLLAQTFPAD